ncbi:hypothetical protein [Deinococcus roseus]|nr:hypothetical protein [Deinococcus roseus]
MPPTRMLISCFSLMVLAGCQTLQIPQSPLKTLGTRTVEKWTEGKTGFVILSQTHGEAYPTNTTINTHGEFTLQLPQLDSSLLFEAAFTLLPGCEFKVIPSDPQAHLMHGTLLVKQDGDDTRRILQIWGSSGVNDTSQRFHLVYSDRSVHLGGTQHCSTLFGPYVQHNNMQLVKGWNIVKVEYQGNLEADVTASTSLPAHVRFLY